MINFLRKLSQLNLERVGLILVLSHLSKVLIVFLYKFVDHATSGIILIEGVG